MIIKKATAEDIPEMISLLERCYKEMDYDSRGYGFNGETVERTLSEIMGGMGVVFTANGDVIMGVGAMFITPSFMDDRKRVAIECVWHSDPMLNEFTRGRTMLALLDGMEREVHKRNIGYLHISSSMKFPATRKILEKRGYGLEELHYVKAVN